MPRPKLTALCAELHSLGAASTVGLTHMAQRLDIVPRHKDPIRSSKHRCTHLCQTRECRIRSGMICVSRAHVSVLSAGVPCVPQRTKCWDVTHLGRHLSRQPSAHYGLPAEHHLPPGALLSVSRVQTVRLLASLSMTIEVSKMRSGCNHCMSDRCLLDTTTAMCLDASWSGQCEANAASAAFSG